MNKLLNTKYIPYCSHLSRRLYLSTIKNKIAQNHKCIPSSHLSYRFYSSTIENKITIENQDSLKILKEFESKGFSREQGEIIIKAIIKIQNHEANEALGAKIDKLREDICSTLICSPFGPFVFLGIVYYLV